MNYLCLDGKWKPSTQPVFLADNKSYRYGDGLFETIRVQDGEVRHASYHFERFFAGLTQLKIELPVLMNAEKLRKQILLLCTKNGCAGLARVRLSAFRGNGGIFEGNDDLHYLIECWPLTASVKQLNENGLQIGIYPDARKICDAFSPIKSANCLPYVMAARHAREQKLNDCLVLNQYGRICESSIANIFIIKGDNLFTPWLSEGCVNGVMRRVIMEKMTVVQKELDIADLREADECFLSNAIYGLKWVRQLEEKTFQNIQTKKIYQEIMGTI